MSLSAYTMLGWVDGGPPAISGANLGHMDQQIKDLTDWALALPTWPVAGISLDARGTTAPTGTLAEDGSNVLRTGANARLFAYLGTLYGVGDGSTTFALPDSRGRVNVGKGTHTDVDTVGKNEGGAVGTRRVKHKHTVALGFSDPGHYHGVVTDAGISSPGSHAVSRSSDYAGTITSGNTTSVGTGITFSPTVGPQTGSEPTDGAAYLVSLKVVTL